jgi:hypothetical protein
MPMLFNGWLYRIDFYCSNGRMAGRTWSCDSTLKVGSELEDADTCSQERLAKMYDNEP